MAKKIESKHLNLIKVYAVPAVIVLWLLNLSVVLFLDDFGESGTFGDTFGAVNALFSGLAFVGLIYAILLQRDQLELQREELKETRKELKATRAEFKDQNETMKRQRFENTFFRMIDLHNDVINSIVIRRSDGNNAVGRAVLSSVANSVEHSAKREDDAKAVQLKKDIKAYFEEHYDSQMGLYFRNLYRIYKFLDESDIEDKNLYAKVLRAQFSNSELKLLFYNCYLYEKGKKFAIYAEKYDLFDNLPEDDPARLALQKLEHKAK